MKFALLTGSLREDSFNKKLLSVISNIIKREGLGEVEFLDNKDLPVYNEDIEQEGMPSSIIKMSKVLKSVDALIVSTPEYNESISSPLKNTIDWVSRNKPMPFAELPVLLTGTSPGGLGAIRGLAHSKVPFEALGSFVFPQTYALPKAHEAFSIEGELSDSSMEERLKKLILKFTNYSNKLKYD